jgi:hypothetical protein
VVAGAAFLAICTALAPDPVRTVRTYADLLFGKLVALPVTW